MKYTPNFSDIRVRKRCRRALGWACGVMSTTKPRAWSTREIDRYFGCQRNELSGYLRQLLLITTNNHWSIEQHKCKEYCLNESGIKFLQEQLNIVTHTIHPIVVEVAEQDYAQELATGNFEYADKSDRLWHPLQRYRRDHKRQILARAGYQHQYDIAACAPTLIHQLAQQQGMDLYLPALRDYLANKTHIRQDLAQALELPVAAVKEIINALFAGAVISQNTRSDIYHILVGDRARIECLKQNKYITELRENIKTCWESLRPLMQTRTRITKSGRERLLPITSKQKWHLYFARERQVMSCVRTYLDQHTKRYFLEHDGWTCESPIDVESLRVHVREQTGFDLTFEYNEILQYNNIPYCSGSRYIL